MILDFPETLGDYCLGIGDSCGHGCRSAEAHGGHSLQGHYTSS